MASTGRRKSAALLVEGEGVKLQRWSVSEEVVCQLSSCEAPRNPCCEGMVAIVDELHDAHLETLLREEEGDNEEQRGTEKRERE